MAKRNPNTLTARSGNPFLHIPFSRADLGTVDGGGGGGKLFVEITPQYRQALVTRLSTARESLSTQMAMYPEALGTVIFKLREEAIAKSHRPTKLKNEAGIESAGHANIDEMLVAADESGFAELESIILNREIKEINANLSAIESILPWTVERKTPTGFSSLRNNNHALIRLFQYSGEDSTQLNYNNLVQLLDLLSISYEEVGPLTGPPLIRVIDINLLPQSSFDRLMNYPGIRYIIPEPRYSAFPVSSSGSVIEGVPDFSVPSSDMPTVAVFDTGVSRSAISLLPWVVGNDTYVVPPDTRFEHGTMVASLVSGAKIINNDHSWIPTTRSYVYDVCGLEEDGSYISDLELRLSEAIRKRPEIKVWNLSLGGEPCKEQEFSEFAMTLDQLSDQYGVLFVVAAGNYVSLPRRSWPTNITNDSDRISSPGESVRALTVGSLTHHNTANSIAKLGEPTPYSRRGPGPVFTPKPDVTHVGGGVHSPWNVGESSLRVIDPNNRITSNFGTSFAAPIVSSLAAHTWNSISSSPDLQVTPSLVKALLIHSAQLTSPDYSTVERRYYGAGRPQEVLDTLYDTDDSFTLVFQTHLVAGMRWRKDNYPIPASLMDDGKFKGEIIITAAYAPPLNANAGSEYVRANVELSFGVITDNSMKGKVPMEGEAGQSGYESAQIEHGGKWSPVKIHRKIFPRGTAGEHWGIQARATLRAFEPILSDPLPVSIIVTLRSIDGNPNVHADGVRALAAKNWLNSRLPNRIPLNI